MRKDTKAKLFMLSLGFFILITYPILGVADKIQMVAGFPLLFIYLFGLWGLLIAFTVWIVLRPKEK